MASQTGKRKIGLGEMPNGLSIKVKRGSTHKEGRYSLELKDFMFSTYLARFQDVNLELDFLYELFWIHCRKKHP